MKSKALLLLLIVATAASGQNLVPNPGFEQFYKIPGSFNLHAADFRLPGWNSPNRGTPDYYHPESWGNSGVPKNWAGVSEAHGGKCYVGIFVGGGFNDRSYREYIQAKLTSPLVADTWYVLQFYYRLASNAQYNIDRVGMHLYSSELQLDHDKVFEVDPTLSVVRTPTENSEWEQARMVYKAQGGESYVIIGNFYDKNDTKSLLLKSRAGKSEVWMRRSYFYIDDVSVTQVEPSFNDTTSVWSERLELKPHQNYVLNNIQFEFDSYELVPSSFTELDEVVRAMKNNPSWKVEIRGHADDQGSDEYNMELSANRAKGVAQYLQAGGIESDRMQTIGFGKATPLIAGTDEHSRTVNRRVEVYFRE